MIPPRESTLPDVTWMTVTEVADYLRVNPMSVRRAIGRGELAATRVGRTYRINEAHVAAYAAPRTPAKLEGE